MVSFTATSNYRFASQHGKRIKPVFCSGTSPSSRPRSRAQISRISALPAMPPLFAALVNTVRVEMRPSDPNPGLVALSRASLACSFATTC